MSPLAEAGLTKRKCRRWAESGGFPSQMSGLPLHGNADSLRGEDYRGSTAQNRKGRDIPERTGICPGASQDSRGHGADRDSSGTVWNTDSA